MIKQGERVHEASQMVEKESSLRGLWRVLSIVSGSRVGALIVTFLLFSDAWSLQAQSCAMCKTTAQALSNVWALNVGIILLLIPPLGIMPAFLYLAFKGRS